MTFPVYEHFLFTSDTTFLREKAYPLMKGAAEFVLDFLVESPEGYLVTNPSHSPENSFRVQETGHRHMSHLLGLYPLAQFTPESPELFKAAQATIERRLSYGGGHTGWSRA